MNFKNFWKITILSFHSSNLYLTIAYKWKHWGLNFLLRFSIFLGSIASIILFILISSINFDQLSPVLEQIPELVVENNQANFSDSKLKSPIYIKSPGSSNDIIIIDLGITQATKYQQNIIVFTKDRIAFNIIESGNFSITYDKLLIGSDTKILNSQSLFNMIQNIKNKFLGSILILGVPLISLIYFTLTLLKATIYAFFATALAKVLKYNLNFKQLTRLAVIVNTPAALVSAALILIFFNTGLFNMAASIIIDNIYLFYFVCVFTLCGRKKSHN